MTTKDVLWCEECGVGLPWPHKKRTTSRRRIIAPLARMLWDVSRPLSIAAQALYNWADKPELKIYEAKRAEQDRRLSERLARERVGGIRP
jgi:hypothetical protein